MKLRLFNVLTLGMMTAICIHSSNVEAIFASVKSTGMAATAISYPLDTLAGAYNPAGMIDIGDRFDLEAGWVYDTGSTEVEGNIALNATTHSPVLSDNGETILNPYTNGTFNGMKKQSAFPVNVGINKLWCIAPDWELSTGIIVYNRNFQRTTYGSPIRLLGTTKPGLEYLNETVAPIVAIKWCNSHSLGISIDYQIERLKVTGLENFDRPVIPGYPGGSLAPGYVTNRGYGYSTGWGVTVGYHGQITNELSIGLTFAPETSMSKMKRYKGFLAQGGKLNIPQKIGAGISYRVIPCLIFAFDVEHIQWSKIKALHNPFLEDGTLNPLGSENSPGFGFRDQMYYRFGVEWEIDQCWTVRAGYRYANTPVKSSQTAVNLLLLDVVESFGTLGATWSVTENNELSFVFAYGFENEVKGKDSIPSFLGGGNANLKSQKFALGLAWGYHY